jgi:hypothetical protein
MTIKSEFYGKLILGVKLNQLDCEKCEHKEYCEDENECLLDYQINKIKDKGRKNKQEVKYMKIKKADFNN